MERAEMQRHTFIGESIIGDSNSPMLRELKTLAKHHHERWDGTGYPTGLKGEEIPITCRIVAVADTFDALTNFRVTKPPLSKEEAIAEIKRLSGSYFDPAVVDAFVHIYGR
jgi:putative two-component system response regulator